MINTLGWLRHLPYPAICLSFSATLSAAEAPPEPARGNGARTARPGCAKLVCQPRGPAADLGGGTEHPEAAETASTAAVRLGLGAGAFRFPKAEVIWETVTQQLSGESSEFVLGPPTVEERDVDIEGAAVSLGVSLEQPLASSSALRWSLEERLSFVAVLPLEGGSLVGGFVDVLVNARVARLPVRLGVGPSLGVALLHVNDDLISLEEPAVIVGGAAVIALDLEALLPGTLELVGHFGKPLTYDDALHRDLQLAFAVPL